ncbi:hypothetical protein ANO11243_094050 [Dothideomycetidae sp. 11243]|nr:hypothetical protein ANO11243_094050 [fungal sp. No.11243]
MLGATSDGLDATDNNNNTATTNSNTVHVGEIDQRQRTSTNFRCNSCHVTFSDGQRQRKHMKEPWHLYNMQRRMRSLPSVNLAQFQALSEEKAPARDVPGEIPRVSLLRHEFYTDERDNDYDIEIDDHQESWPFRCLFCNHSFQDDDIGLSQNLQHMHTVHDLFIPDQDMVTDMRTLVGYLATEVRVWHECLYCGATKHSTSAIQSHMRDKRHCALNFDREPELMEFWECPPGDEKYDYEGKAVPTRLATSLKTEICLDSGKMLVSRRASPVLKRPPKSRTPEPPSTSLVPSLSTIPQQPMDDAAPLPSPSRQLVRREDMSLAGISQQQRQALILAEKKAQRSEAVARRAREWVYAKGANLQKFDQIDGSGKWGKQNHSLLPR